MERIIKGQKRYNTDTAKAKARYEAGEGSTWYRETLYRKKTGEYFIHGEGNSQSKYGKSKYTELGKQWEHGEEIIPLTYVEAQEWVKKHLGEAEYRKLFVNVSKGGKCQCHLVLRSTAAEILKRAASKTGKQQAEIVSDLIEKYL